MADGNTSNASVGVGGDEGAVVDEGVGVDVGVGVDGVGGFVGANERFVNDPNTTLSFRECLALPDPEDPETTVANHPKMTELIRFAFDSHGLSKDVTDEDRRAFAKMMLSRADVGPFVGKQYQIVVFQLVNFDRMGLNP